MSAIDDDTLLDNPAWYSLSGPHARFAEVHGTARRYQPDVSVFVGLPDERDEQTWDDLATLVGPGVQVAVNGVTIAPPPQWEVLGGGSGVQMIDMSVDAVPDDEAVVLGPADAADMIDLVERTKPGPWRPRTYELGTYLGVRREGRLVAMAGERLHPQGWTEISAVCTDEAWRRSGFAGRLVQHVAYNIRSRGDKALLHAAENNTSAIRLYEKLGFELRRTTTFMGLLSPTAVAP